MPDEHVAILLATRNGHRFLGEQLQSYVSQTHGDWSLHVSDDGSSDASGDIITRFAGAQSHKVTFREGPCRGFCENFMSLAQDRELVGDYFAFSDQDDIWYPDKLERALSFLRAVPQTSAALYCSKTELVDENGRHLGFSPSFVRTPTFRNALVQNIGGGNTMVFNTAAKRLLEAVAQVELVSHDWWLYQAVSAAGGAVFYDLKPTVKYRQHEGNILGSNADLHAKLLRLRIMLAGGMATWNEINANALRSIQSVFHPSSLEAFEAFVAARNARGLVARLFFLHKSGVYRQTFFGQISLWVAACFRRL